MPSRSVYVKESLGEYGSGWEWENTSTLAFDQTNTYRTVKNPATGVDEQVLDSTPIRYTNSGTSMGYCYDEVERTNGEILNSGSYMSYQDSCGPNVGNAGNWYSWSASTAGGQSSSKEPNSICPKGWQLTTNTATDIKSYYYLIRTAYNISEDNNDSRIRPLPMSFIRSGLYYLGSLNNRGSYGYYWSAVASSSTGAYFLYFSSGSLNPQSGDNKYAGFSVRCVSR